MRGVTVQSVADVLGVLRAARALDVAAASSPTSNPIRFGPVVLFGHGQGAAAVSIAAPRTNVDGVVLAGHGGSFLDLFPTKTRFASTFAVAPIVLGESPLAGSPVLSLLQSALDAEDPVAHAEALVRSGATAKKHVFMVYGQGDSFAPAPTQAAYALAAGLGVAAPPGSVTNADPIQPTTLPVPAGANVAGGTFTAIVRQYAAPGSDGHYSAFVDPNAVADVDRFVADVARAVVPMIGR